MMSKNSRDSKLNVETAIPHQPREFVSLNEFIIWVAIGVLLTLFFWTDLWLGWSFVGGDVYAYFMPQKFYYAKHLQEGLIPFWNNTTGHGYPILGESQTAALYPPNLLLYYFLDVITAYNSSHLLHYVLAFVGTALFAVHLGYQREVAFFIGFVFVYGWFPVKRCLEWAIITGAYLPWLLLLTDLWLVQNKKRWLVGVSILLSLQLLAGHYNLAFISLLAIVCFGTSRVCGWMTGVTKQSSSLVPVKLFKTAGMLTAAIILGFSIAAIQLIPTLELKANSQRRELTGDYQPAYGHLPLWYLQQCILPWKWYSLANLDDQLQAKAWHISSAGTNQVEAHFYLGLLPLGLLFFSTIIYLIKRKEHGWYLFLWGMTLFFLILASGLLMPVLSSLPGFGFFTGPGRYSVIAHLCLALIAGHGLQHLSKLLPNILSVLLVFIFTLVTFVDYSWVSESIYYTITVEHAPLKKLSDSHLLDYLDSQQTMPRVFGPSQNMLTLFGHSQTPTYLGIGPKEYWDEKTALPKESISYKKEVDLQGMILSFPERQEWLQRAGVTHILTFKPLEKSAWDCQLLTQVPDIFVNSMVGRGLEPVYFYKLNKTRGRLSWQNAQTTQGIKLLKHSPHEIIVETESTLSDTLVLTELDFPGWTATIDGVQTTNLKIDNIFRGVKITPGKHLVVWTYRPSSILIGGAISLLSIFLVLGFVIVSIKINANPEPKSI